MGVYAYFVLSNVVHHIYLGHSIASPSSLGATNLNLESWLDVSCWSLPHDSSKRFSQLCPQTLLPWRPPSVYSLVILEPTDFGLPSSLVYLSLHLTHHTRPVLSDHVMFAVENESESPLHSSPDPELMFYHSGVNSGMSPFISLSNMSEAALLYFSLIYLLLLIWKTRCFDIELLSLIVIGNIDY